MLEGGGTKLVIDRAPVADAEAIAATLPSASVVAAEKGPAGLPALGNDELRHAVSRLLDRSHANEG